MIEKRFSVWKLAQITSEAINDRLFEAGFDLSRTAKPIDQRLDSDTQEIVFSQEVSSGLTNG